MLKWKGFFHNIGQYYVQYCAISVNAGLANTRIMFLTILLKIKSQYCVQYWAMSVNIGLANIKIRFSTILGNICNLHQLILCSVLSNLWYLDRTIYFDINEQYLKSTLPYMSQFNIGQYGTENLANSKECWLSYTSVQI